MFGSIWKGLVRAILLPICQLNVSSWLLTTVKTDLFSPSSVPFAYNGEDAQDEDGWAESESAKRPERKNKAVQEERKKAKAAAKEKKNNAVVQEETEEDKGKYDSEDRSSQSIIKTLYRCESSVGQVKGVYFDLTDNQWRVRIMLPQPGPLPLPPSWSKIP